jgi:hypothetical protein
MSGMATQPLEISIQTRLSSVTRSVLLNAYVVMPNVLPLIDCWLVNYAFLLLFAVRETMPREMLQQ